MFSKDDKHHKCCLDCIEDIGWRISHHCHNDTECWRVDLPNLVENFQSFVDDGSLIPGWQRPTTWLLGKASHISAVSLTQPAPSFLKKALLHDNPDRNIWLDSHKQKNRVWMIMAPMKSFQLLNVTTSVKKKEQKPSPPCVCSPSRKMNSTTLSELRAKLLCWAIMKPSLGPNQIAMLLCSHLTQSVCSPP